MVEPVTEALLPCPFCNAAIIVEGDDELRYHHSAVQGGCFLRGLHFDADGLAQWNTRAARPMDTEMIELAIDAMVDAWSEADAHHEIRATCEHLYRAALASLPIQVGD